jgi:hypothetical protein
MAKGKRLSLFARAGRAADRQYKFASHRDASRYAFMIGFMIGWRAAKREGKR